MSVSDFTVLAVGFVVSKADSELITRMVTNLLGVEEHQITIVDAQSYEPTVKSDTQTIVLTYGARAWKQFINANPGFPANLLVKLPLVTQLHKQPENKNTRLETAKLLQSLKGKMENGLVSIPTEKPKQEEVIVSSFFAETKPCEVTVRFEDGKELKVGPFASSDALPEEMQSFLQLLMKISQTREIEIEFIKNSGSSST